MVSIDKEKCIGCSLCANANPEVFEMVEGQAQVKAGQEGNQDVQNDIDNCPVGAITN